MPKVNRQSEHLFVPENFHPAVLGTSVLRVSVTSTTVIFVRIEGWYGKTMRGTKVLMDRQYDNVSRSSLRRLSKAVSNIVNKGKANIYLNQVGETMCYEVEI